MKAYLSFCYDLTSPEAKSVEIGVLITKDDKFERFDWTCDRDKLGLSPFSAEVLRVTPNVLQAEVNAGWPAFYREREMMTFDPKNAAEYVAMVRRHSSIFVTRIEQGGSEAT